MRWLVSLLVCGLLALLPRSAMADPDSQPEQTTCQTDAELGACDAHSDVTFELPTTERVAAVPSSDAASTQDAIVQLDTDVDMDVQQAVTAGTGAPQPPVARSIDRAATVQPPFRPVDVPAPASESLAPHDPPSYQHLPPGPASRWP